MLCPLPVILRMRVADQNSKEEVKRKYPLPLIFLHMNEGSYKGKNVAVLCPMSLMVQGVGMKTNLSANKYNGVLYYP